MPADYYPAVTKCEADERWKALSFYKRRDGVTVDLWKMAWTAVSTNGGKTWSKPVQASGFARTFAKLWGQRNSDGRYAIAYDSQNGRPLKSPSNFLFG